MDFPLTVNSIRLMHITLHFVELLMHNAAFLAGAAICGCLRNILHAHFVVCSTHKHMKGNKWESLECEPEQRWTRGRWCVYLCVCVCVCERERTILRCRSSELGQFCQMGKNYGSMLMTKDLREHKTNSERELSVQVSVWEHTGVDS